LKCSSSTPGASFQRRLQSVEPMVAEAGDLAHDDRVEREKRVHGELDVEQVIVDARPHEDRHHDLALPGDPFEAEVDPAIAAVVGPCDLVEKAHVRHGLQRVRVPDGAVDQPFAPAVDVEPVHRRGRRGLVEDKAAVEVVVQVDVGEGKRVEASAGRPGRAELPVDLQLPALDPLAAAQERQVGAALAVTTTFSVFSSASRSSRWSVSGRAISAVRPFASRTAAARRSDR
jgi:hypothetical protein